ncbi:DNA-directed primase/polymerase protein [Larimichthys crocea]|uniref:DNA-directed primase/polymerase protein n=1 Tax=Larimichthys crocea TaxID=215358 RepID=A0A6G0J8X2_LARCR|nr:DNA-directed primase/polymerase protein [Larimichthys crocea]
MKKWGDRLKKVEQLAQSFHLNPLASPYKPRLWPCQPSSVWKLFPRQSMAIGFAQSCREAVHVFALEKEKASLGQRIYLVTSYSELWHYYRTYTQSLMHCYEVIPEGAVCKLYFDLEFHKPSNKEPMGKLWCLHLSSMFATSCWKFTGLNAPQKTSSILTPAQKRSSVGISSSISKTQLSKTTYTWGGLSMKFFNPS